MLGVHYHNTVLGSLLCHPAQKQCAVGWAGRTADQPARPTNGRHSKRYSGQARLAAASASAGPVAPHRPAPRGWPRVDHPVQRFPALGGEIAALYSQRWQIELLFQWIKQHLKIRAFLGRSENAIRLQLYAAIIAYLLLRIAARATLGAARIAFCRFGAHPLARASIHCRARQAPANANHRFRCSKPAHFRLCLISPGSPALSQEWRKMRPRGPGMDFHTALTRDRRPAICVAVARPTPSDAILRRHASSPSQACSSRD